MLLIPSCEFLVNIWVVWINRSCGLTVQYLSLRFNNYFMVAVCILWFESDSLIYVTAGRIPSAQQTLLLGCLIGAGCCLIANIIYIGVPMVGFKRRDQTDIVVSWCCIAETFGSWPSPIFPACGIVVVPLSPNSSSSDIAQDPAKRKKKCCFICFPHIERHVNYMNLYLTMCFICICAISIYTDST